jgi:hypothetical protein
MSDDDLWRPKDPGPATPGEEPPAAPADGSTQPIAGGEGSGPGAVPPAYNPYAGPQDSAAPSTSAHGQQPPGPSQGGFPAGPGPGYGPPPNPYAPPNEYAAPQSPYGAPYQPAYAGGQLPDHPSATTAMVLGIIGLAGLVFCAGITLVLSPAAWIVGGKAVREIDASGGRYTGRDRAAAGKVMGIIGTVLLALGILAIIAFVVLIVAVGSSDSGSSSPNPVFGNGA